MFVRSLLGGLAPREDEARALRSRVLHFWCSSSNKPVRACPPFLDSFGVDRICCELHRLQHSVAFDMEPHASSHVIVLLRSVLLVPYIFCALTGKINGGLEADRRNRDSGMN